MPTRIASLPSRALVRVTGPDARPFLHTLLTQDVESLAAGELRFGALLSPPGRLLFDLFLLGQGDGVILDVAADRREALIQRLSMYRLRADVTIEAVDTPVMAAWNGDGDGFIPDPRAPGLGATTAWPRRMRPRPIGWRISWQSGSRLPATSSSTRPIRSRPISTCCTASTSRRAVSSVRKPPRGCGGAVRSATGCCRSHSTARHRRWAPRC